MELPQTLESAGVPPSKCSEEGEGPCPVPSPHFHPGSEIGDFAVTLGPLPGLKPPHVVTKLRATGKRLLHRWTSCCLKG